MELRLRSHNLFGFTRGSGPSLFEEGSPQDEAKAGGQKILERKGGSTVSDFQWGLIVGWAVGVIGMVVIGRLLEWLVDRWWWRW